MYIKCWGSRGSTPVSGKKYLKYGGDTTCLEIRTESNDIIIVDAGTGIRNVGLDIFKQGSKPQDNLFILFSHTHWDHIQGFPFFGPAYDPNQKFTLVLPNRTQTAKGLQDIFSIQMQDEYFPVPLDKMGSHDLQ